MMEDFEVFALQGANTTSVPSVTSHPIVSYWVNSGEWTPESVR